MRAGFVKSSFVFSSKRWDPSYFLGCDRDEADRYEKAVDNLNSAYRELTRAENALISTHRRKKCFVASGCLKEIV